MSRKILSEVLMGSSGDSSKYFFLEVSLRVLGGQEDEVAVEVRTISFSS